MKQIFKDFQDSVVELADKLPQWSSEDVRRRRYSAMFSLCEEAGEISGLMSKYRCRKKKDIDYYNTAFENLPEENKEEIRNKFIDETGDFLWVLVCSEHSLLGKETVLYTMLRLYADYILEQSCNIEYVLMRLINETSAFFGKDFCYSEQPKDIIIASSIKRILNSFTLFCAELYFEYNITLEEIIEHNMEKLGVRYDKNGKRTDGK